MERQKLNSTKTKNDIKLIDLFKGICSMKGIAKINILFSTKFYSRNLEELFETCL